MYELNIESRHSDFYGKRFRKYSIDGYDTVGVFGGDPFAITLYNWTDRRVEACISIDGTDVLTGAPANPSPEGRRWLVEPRRTVTLTAWPESRSGGAGFVFGHEGQSVAAHTHGDTSQLGWIAAAIFEEGAPVARAAVLRHGLEAMGPRRGGGSAVGAGSYTEQRIETVSGLRDPRLAQILRVRHMWWDDLSARLQAPAPARMTGPVFGFPGATEEPFKGISLGTTPRVETLSRFT